MSKILVGALSRLHHRIVGTKIGLNARGAKVKQIFDFRFVIFDANLLKTQFTLYYICKASMKKLLALLFSALFFLPEAKGQNGEIYGTATDEKGIPFQNVSIGVFQGKKLLFSTVSEEDGSYSLKPMPVGCFKVEFKAEHYIKTTILDLPISSGGIVKLDCKMIKGSSDSEIITVYKMPKILRHYPLKHILLNNNEGRIHCQIGSHCSPLSLSENVKMSKIQAPSIKPNYIYLSWSEQLKYSNFPQFHRQKQINKKYSEKDFQYIPFEHFLKTLSGLLQ